ncbi:hypothetical protein BDF22DRAFT_655530 [Syncephalis plumigaleata]|nr:hypothetical protein BDF22DRAFT_655530 [Syncephalis plumigaleata]
MTSKRIDKHSGGSGYTATEIYEPVMDLFSDTRTPGHENMPADWLHLISHKPSRAARAATTRTATTNKKQAEWPELQEYANATSVTNLPDDAIDVAADKNQNQSSMITTTTPTTTTNNSSDAQTGKKSYSSSSSPHDHPHQQHHYYNLDVISGVREEIPESELLYDDGDTSSSDARMTSSTSQQPNDRGNSPFDRIHHLFRR